MDELPSEFDLIVVGTGMSELHLSALYIQHTHALIDFATSVTHPVFCVC